MCPLFFKSDSFGWHYYIYRYVGILKLDKGGLGCCQRRVVVYKTEDTSSWLHTIYMEMSRFHQTEQNLNILIDIPISKKLPFSFISFVDFPIVCMITTLLQLQNFPQCLFFQKKLCIYNTYAHTYTNNIYNTIFAKGECCFFAKR